MGKTGLWGDMGKPVFHAVNDDVFHDKWQQESG
jgi:hypothetical protein